MEIIPAIDLRGGRCVRLVQGDYDKETVFGEDPIEVALSWQSQGARRIHVVDLDGAREGRPAQMETVLAIASRIGVPLQVGGGIRGKETARHYLEGGVDRVVVGSVAVRSPELVREMVEAFGGRLVVGIDAREGRVAVAGWTETSQVQAPELGRLMVEAGVRTFVFTDIARDGTLEGPNIDALREFASAVHADVIASGGIGSIHDVRRVRETGVAGLIIGRALYTGDVSLPMALQATS